MVLNVLKYCGKLTFIAHSFTWRFVLVGIDAIALTSEPEAPPSLHLLS